jgi:carboxyl-terminal processing protease
VKRRVLVLSTAVLLLFAALVYGSVFSSFGAGPESAVQAGDAGNLLEIVSLVRARFYRQVDVADLLSAYASTGSVRGMLAQALGDPYTRYMDQHAYESLMSDTSGVFGGIGIVIGIRDEQLTIISPIKGTPGERAGLRANDRIIRIGDRDTNYMTTDEAASLMRGEPGTEVTITIQRDEESFDVTIVRDMISVNSIEKIEMLEPGIGYIHLTNFSDRTYRELVEALDQLDAEGIEGLILDLRFNPGGTLSAALQVADEFVSSGDLLHLEDRDGNRSSFAAVEEGTRTPIPMVVLINGSSASASEIVAGALRDHGLAVLVGTTTFGKGLVQSIVPLRDGGAISLTEQVYLTAGGHDINEVGIVPDYEIEISEEEELAIYFGEAEVDLQLEKAVEIIRSQIYGE